MLRWKKPKAKLNGYTLAYTSRDGPSQKLRLPPTATSLALDDLNPDTLYSVALTAERGPKKSSPVSLSASTGGWSIEELVLRHEGAFIWKYFVVVFLDFRLNHIWQFISVLKVVSAILSRSHSSELSSPSESCTALGIDFTGGTKPVHAQNTEGRGELARFVLDLAPNTNRSDVTQHR